MFPFAPEMGFPDSNEMFYSFPKFRDLDRHSFSWINIKFLWTHKNLVLFPLDVVFDCLQAKSHFDNDNIWWCYLTILLICLPNVLFLVNLVVESLGKTSSTQTNNEKSSSCIINAMLHFLFLHFITLYR